MDDQKLVSAIVAVAELGEEMYNLAQNANQKSLAVLLDLSEEDLVSLMHDMELALTKWKSETHKLLAAVAQGRS
jgi:hypothetical protein